MKRNAKGQFTSESLTTHGMHDTKQYTIWECLRMRCDKKERKGYHRYGGRGITYDQKWRTFIGFWNDMKEKWEFSRKMWADEPLSIDRIDNDGNYTKDNCRFIPRRLNNAHTYPLNKASSKSVWQCDKDTGERIKKFPSLSEAQRQTRTCQTTIGRVASGSKKHKTAGGYRWEFA